jgi:hypothetical protein
MSVDKARQGAGFGLKTTATMSRGDVVVEYSRVAAMEAERLKRATHTAEKKKDAQLDAVSWPCWKRGFDGTVDVATPTA